MPDARRRAALAALALALAGCGAAPAGPDTTALDAAPPRGSPVAVEPRPGEQACNRPGRSDINGDGYADGVIGERGGAGAAGAVRVLYGTPVGLTSTGAEGGLDDQHLAQGSPGVPGTSSERAEWGKALAVGDFDGDGCADVAVGAPGKPLGGADDHEGSSVGEVTVLYGSPAGLGTAHARTIDQGPDLPQLDRDVVRVPGTREADDRFGSVLTAGDFDGDGLADLAVAALGDAPGANRTYRHVPPCDPGYPTGFRASSATSKCMGPWTAVRDRGTVTVLYGSRHGLGEGVRPARTFTNQGLGGTAADRYDFGKALTAGDFDGDGADDLVISATPNGDEDATAFGVAYVLPGKEGAGVGFRPVQRFERSTDGIPGEGSDEGFGNALAAGDLNGDGSDDLAIGAPFEPMALNSGAVVVLYSRGRAGLGTVGAQEWTPESPGLPRPTGGGDFGASLAIGRFGGPGAAEDPAVGIPTTLDGGKHPNAVTVLFGTGAGLTAAGSVQLVPPTGRGSDWFAKAMSALPVRGGAYDDLLVGAPSVGENATPSDGGGALDAYPTGTAGPRAGDVRRFRPGDAEMAGTPVRGAGFGTAIG